MTITAEIIADSISSAGIRITTFQLRYPRFIHAELMTHRVFSRNASSSRAIPVAKMIEDLQRDPAMPIFWGSNQPGMQAAEELDDEDREACEHHWMEGMHNAVRTAQLLLDHGLHKQIANRILEPWAHINVVVTATDYENFFALRRHKDAQPEIKALADAMWLARANSVPEPKAQGQWHLPYVKYEDWERMRRIRKTNRVTRDEPSFEELAEQLKRVSVARCARVSYLTHDGRETTLEEDIALYERLVGSEPLHASPAEHQATPDILAEGYMGDGAGWHHPELHGNFCGWIQFRKQMPGEFVKG